MRYHHLKTYFDHQRRQLIQHREMMKRRMREDILEIEQDIMLMSKLIRQMQNDRLHETTIKPTKPLTPDQTMKRAEKNRERQQQIRDIQASASKRVADIKSKIGQ
jgi:hypothetical protein